VPLTKCYQRDQIKEDETVGAYNTERGKRNAYSLVVDKHDTNIPLGRPNHR